MITVTETAAEHIRGIIESQGKQVRLGVKGGGCAGFSYDWQLLDESEIDELNDEQIDMGNGHNLIIDSMSIMYLFGSTVDFKTGVFGATLEIETPAAQSACGCGESVNFDMDMVEANMGNFNMPDDGVV